MNLNKVMLCGNITKDPELKQTKSGQNVCSFSIATNRKWKDKSGQQQEDVQFHNCVAWGRTAEVICQYSLKGAGLLIEGRLQTRTWDAKDGTKRYTTEVVVENMQLGPRRPQNERKNDPLDALPPKDDLKNTDLNPNSIPESIPNEYLSAEDLPF